MSKSDKPKRPSEDISTRILGDTARGSEAEEDSRGSPGADGHPENPDRDAAEDIPRRNREQTGPHSGPGSSGRKPGGK